MSRMRKDSYIKVANRDIEILDPGGVKALAAGSAH